MVTKQDALQTKRPALFLLFVTGQPRMDLSADVNEIGDDMDNYLGYPVDNHCFEITSGFPQNT